MKIKNAKIITEKTVKTKANRKNISDCACEPQHDKNTELCASGDCACSTI